jgi:hypothetical protein
LIETTSRYKPDLTLKDVFFVCKTPSSTAYPIIRFLISSNLLLSYVKNPDGTLKPVSFVCHDGREFFLQDDTASYESLTSLSKKFPTFFKENCRKNVYAMTPNPLPYDSYETIKYPNSSEFACLNSEYSMRCNVIEKTIKFSYFQNSNKSSQYAFMFKKPSDFPTIPDCASYLSYLGDNLQLAMWLPQSKESAETSNEEESEEISSFPDERDLTFNRDIAMVDETEHLYSYVSSNIRIFYEISPSKEIKLNKIECHDGSDMKYFRNSRFSPNTEETLLKFEELADENCSQYTHAIPFNPIREYEETWIERQSKKYLFCWKEKEQFIIQIEKSENHWIYRIVNLVINIKKYYEPSVLTCADQIAILLDQYHLGKYLPQQTSN